MPRRLVSLTSALIAALTIAAPAAVPSAAHADGWARAGMVQAQGGPYLTDALGRVLQLHGVNLVGKCGGGSADLPEPGTPCVGPAQGPRLAYVLSPDADDPGRRFTAADAATLAQLGFNVVRLGIIWEGLEPGPANAAINDPHYCGAHRAGTPYPRLASGTDPYNPATVRAYLTRTDRIVSLLAHAGLRVIVDMHSDAYGSAFFDAKGTTPWNAEGAPLWATCTGGARFVPTRGWGKSYLLHPVQEAMHHFFANDVRGDLQGQYARVWQAVARHFRGNRTVLGYEIYNEPNDFETKHFEAELQCDYGGPVNEPKSCALARPQALPHGLIGAIQSADPRHVVFFEPSGDTNFGAPVTLGITEPLPFPRLALAFHAYGEISKVVAGVTDERAHMHTDQPHGPALILDEFGASNNAGLSSATVALAEGENLSWAFWAAMQLNDPTGGQAYEGLLDQTTRQPYPNQARSMSVPYAWATAGTPGAQSFYLPARTYRYRYTPSFSIHAPTEIEIPPYTYPLGYTATVAGAHVTSPPNAALLTLSADRHAKSVSVTVRSLSSTPFPTY
ncbi:MAG TPA: cellulase family glycosylhydrolase [Solirubrobacteraceae bacterium]|nr:cellulase family glycosylhydrolase [Solirubrobacteraceae bacterium]